MEHPYAAKRDEYETWTAWLADARSSLPDIERERFDASVGLVNAVIGFEDLKASWKPKRLRDFYRAGGPATLPGTCLTPEDIGYYVTPCEWGRTSMFGSPELRAVDTHLDACGYCATKVSLIYESCISDTWLPHLQPDHATKLLEQLKTIGVTTRSPRDWK